MRDLRISLPVLKFIFYDWLDEFKVDVIHDYENMCRIGNAPREHPVLFEDMVDYTYDWLYQVRSQEEFDDRNHYDRNFVLREGEDAQADEFYDDCHIYYEPQFREDLFAVMQGLGLTFYTHNGGYHNMPMKGVW